MEQVELCARLRAVAGLYILIPLLPREAQGHAHETALISLVHLGVNVSDFPDTCDARVAHIFDMVAKLDEVALKLRNERK